MKDYNIGKIYEIFGDDYNIKISPINTNSYKDISTYIDFLNCENILRRSYELPSSSILTVYQIEIDNTNEQSLINGIEYAVFDENKKRLDLSLCKSETIKINYQMNTLLINMSKVYYYDKLGIDVFNIEHEFFNDICYSYSENGSDMILKDRISDIYENYSLCESNCEYDKVNLIQKTVTCKCDIKTNIDLEVEPPSLAKIILDSFKDSNVAVIKCYYLVFSFKSKFQNIGFLTFTFLVFLHIPFFIHYLRTNISSIIKYIINEMSKFNYLCNQFNPIKKRAIKFNKKKNKYCDNSKNIIKKLNKNKKKNVNIFKNLNLFKKNNYKNNSDISSIAKLKSLNNSNQLNLLENNDKKNIKSRNRIKRTKKGLPFLLFNYKIYNNNFFNLKGSELKKDNEFFFSSKNYSSTH